MKLSDAERGGLSPEEIAALEADPSESEAAAPGAKAAASEEEEKDGADKVDETEGEDKGGDTKAAGEEKKEGADKKDGEEAADGEVETTASEREPFAVPFHHQASVKAEDVKTQLSDLQAQYAEGKLTLDELLAKRDAINEAVVTDRVAGKISEASKDQMAEALWFRAVDDFLDMHGAYKDPVLRDALDSRIKVLATEEANAKLSDRQLLNKAHDEIRARFKVDPDAKPPKDPKAAAADSRKPDLSGVPRTLGSAPSAADNDAADNEFTELDRLAGQDSALYEQALAKLSPAQQDRYLRGVAA